MTRNIICLFFVFVLIRMLKGKLIKSDMSSYPVEATLKKCYLDDKFDHEDVILK